MSRYRFHSHYLLFASLLTLSAQHSFAFELLPIKDEELSAEEKAWLEDDSNLTSLVNDGRLTFVDAALTQGVYSLSNRIRLLADSVETNRIRFTQCHNNLDAINAIDIVYNSQTTSQLQVLSSDKIANIKVGLDKVELYQVQKGAQICIQGISQTLSYNAAEKVWELQRGPYMRKFLDGYYPMHLQEKIELGDSRLSFQNLKIKNGPAMQPIQQLREEQSGTTITLNYYFEGRLEPVYQFRGESK